MRLIKKIFKVLGQLVILLLILANLFILLSGRFYLYKGIFNTYLKGRSGPSIYDKDIFANSVIPKAKQVYQWDKKTVANSLLPEEEKEFSELSTSSFIVIKNDQIIFEKYWNGHKPETVSNSFSAAKTFVSLLVGIALDQGKIKSLDEPIGNYLPAYKGGGKEKITIRHLLMMSSGLDWEESGKNPLSENAESYYGTDLKGLVNRQKAITKPGVLLNYQSGNSQLLGFIVEKATGKDLSKYAHEKIWSKIGTDHDAYWSLDKENGDEKSFCCLYGSSRDFARLGRLILNYGQWNGQEVVSEKYMKEMVSNPKMTTEEGIPNYRYGLHIWTYLGYKNPVYYCRGILGQYIISIPTENLVIVRTGMERKKNIKFAKDKYKIGHPADLFMYLKTAKRLSKLTQ